MKIDANTPLPRTVPERLLVYLEYERARRDNSLAIRAGLKEFIDWVKAQTTT